MEKPVPLWKVILALPLRAPKQLIQRRLWKIIGERQPGSYQQGKEKKTLNARVDRSVSDPAQEREENVPRGTFLVYAISVARQIDRLAWHPQAP